MMRLAALECNVSLFLWLIYVTNCFHMLVFA